MRKTRPDETGKITGKSVVAHILRKDHNLRTNVVQHQRKGKNTTGCIIV